MHGSPHMAGPAATVRPRAAERGGRGRVGHCGARVVTGHQRQRGQQKPPWLLHLRRSIFALGRAFLGISKLQMESNIVAFFAESLLLPRAMAPPPGAQFSFCTGPSTSCNSRKLDVMNITCVLSRRSNSNHFLDLQCRVPGMVFTSCLLGFDSGLSIAPSPAASLSADSDRCKRGSCCCRPSISCKSS